MSELAKLFSCSTNKSPNFETFTLPKTPKAKNKNSQKTVLEEESNKIEDDLNKIDRTEQDKYTIYVGNLPNTYNTKKLVKLFKNIGEVKSARIRAVSTSKAKVPAHMVLKDKIPTIRSLYGYVVFTQIEHTNKAVGKLNGHLIDGRHISVDFCNKNDKKDTKTTVFVSNLQSDVDEEKLRDFFTESGDIIKVHIVSDRITGVSKNFGFVTFEAKSGLILALKKNGEDLEGRNIVVRKANVRNKLDSTKKEIRKTPKVAKSGKFKSTSTKNTAKTNNKLKDLKVNSAKHPSKQKKRIQRDIAKPKQQQQQQQQQQRKKYKKHATKKTKQFRNPLLPKKPLAKFKNSKK